jgi:O-acetyl-ADP-ribose deacetylase (regulator of RNase III)
MPVLEITPRTIPFAAAQIGSWTIFAIAFGMLVVGLGLFFWGLRRSFRHRRTVNPVLWALFAAGFVLLIFSIFPDAAAEGDLGGFTLGGAFAGFAVLWWLGTRLGREAIDADENVERMKQELEGLRAGSAIGSSATDDPVLPPGGDLRYAVNGAKGRELVIITGDLMRVRADVWISPENTNMQPSRFHERSVSAMIRYHGAKHDEDGEPLDDVIGDELAAAMQARHKSVVPEGAVVPTSAGSLTDSHGVKRIYHVAAVVGSLAGGYRPASQIDRCVTRALERMDSVEEEKYHLTTVALPLLATGVAGGDPEQIAPKLVGAAAEYLNQHDGSRVKRVYLVAYRSSELQHWMRAAGSCSLLRRIGGSVEQMLETPVP